MNYAVIKPLDIANGTGIRVSLFVSGCTHRCPGCFNEEAWDFDYGQAFTSDTEDKIIELMKPDYICGFSLLGGEPFEPSNQTALLPLLRKIKAAYPNKKIWCYTGYVYETELLGNSRAVCEHTAEMLSLIDVLVDGRFVESQKDLNLKFRGSSNQRVIDLSETRKKGEVVLLESCIGGYLN